MRSGAYLLPAYIDTNHWDMPDLAATSKRRVEAGQLAPGNGKFTPTYTATTTQPVLGATGFIRGVWTRVGLKIVGWIDISYAGSGVVLGGTALTVGLPFDADTGVHTAGALNAASHFIGDWQSQSPTSAEAKNGMCTLGGTSGPPRMLMYYTGSTTSLGGTDLSSGTSARIKIRFKYMAATAEFP
jgi:hypothetical protein